MLTIIDKRALPIWPEFSTESKYSKKMMQAKQTNGPDYWSVMREVIKHDCETLPMERFKVWASVANVPFMAQQRYPEYLNLINNYINEKPYSDALREPMIGITKEDFDITYSVSRTFPTTMNRIQCVCHLIMNGIAPEDLEKMDTIVELGAGIGDMADVIYKLGFKGTYIIYDFPEIGGIQKWYHNELGLSKVVHTSNLDDLVDADLLIATWSLTEMPFDLRSEIVKRVKGTKRWLLAYSNMIFEMNNHKYITEELVPMFEKTHDAKYTDIPFMPWDGGTKYLYLQPKR